MKTKNERISDIASNIESATDTIYDLLIEKYGLDFGDDGELNTADEDIKSIEKQLDYISNEVANLRDLTIT